MNRTPREGDGREPSSPTDVRHDFDDALWNLLGAAADIPVSDRFTERLSRAAAGRPRPRIADWRYWTAGAAAAAVITFFALDLHVGEDRNRIEVSLPTAAIDGMSDDDLVALDIDGLEFVNQEWFGG